MYSPKISEDLIPELYIFSKQANKPMTRFVDDILRNYLSIYKKYDAISPTGIKNILEIVMEERIDSDVG